MVEIPIIALIFISIFGAAGLLALFEETLVVIKKSREEIKQRKDKELEEKIAKQVDLILCEERIKFFNGVQKAIDLVKKDKKTRSKK